MSRDESSDEVKERVGEGEVDEVVRSIIDELREEVQRSGGTLPNPRQNPEFYMKLLSIIEDPEIKISQKKLAEMLGVSYTLLRNRVHAFRRMMEKGEVPGTPQPIDIDESALSKSLERVVARQVVKHFGKKVDSLTEEYIDSIVKSGIVVVEKYGAWCRENGMDYSDCVDKAMQFFIENRDEIEWIRRRVEAMKAVALALYELSKPNIAKIAALELVRQIVIDALDRNPEALEYITSLVDQILEGEGVV